MQEERAHERVREDGYNIPQDVIRGHFVDGRDNFRDHYRGLMDDWALYDNTGDVPVLVEWGEKV